MRVKTETFGGGDLSWLGSNHGTDNARTGTLVLANFTASEHYPDGHLRSGTPVDASDESNLTPYTGGDGLGFILFDQSVDAGDEQFAVPVVRHGIVHAANLPVDVDLPVSVGGFTVVGGTPGGDDQTDGGEG